MDNPLLAIKNLCTQFFTYEGVIKALDNVNFTIDRGEIFGLVGETGCGKSVTALSILRLVPNPPGKIVSGELIFDGEALLKKSENEMKRIRGRRISMIFQEPMSSLNPVFSIGNLITEVIRYHQKLDRKSASIKCLEILTMVGMPNPENIIHRYPFELSGGMRQRALIALGMSCKPDLLITDEPTTALDVTIQAQILKLIKRLKREQKVSVLIITHDLGVIANICDRMAVMYAGNIVESGSVEALFKNPYHPYTKGLLGAIPVLGKSKEYLTMIKGTVPNLLTPPNGCRFHPRCKHALTICSRKKPMNIQMEESHSVSCFLYS